MTGTVKKSYVSQFGDDPAHSHTPDPEFFFSPAIFEAEKRGIFYRSWNFLCHVSQLPNPGDYVTGTVVDQAIFAIRGQDGTVRAFFNVCRHRAHQLLKGTGNVRSTIRCPYHSWTYDTEGRLRHAPHCDSVAGFDKDEYSVSPVRLAEVGGFVFVNLDADAPDLETWAPGFERRLLAMVPEAPRLRHARTQEFTIGSNWKVVVENFLENYHSFYSGPAHGQLSNIIDQATYSWQIDGKIVEFAGMGGNPDRIPYRMANGRVFTGRQEGFLITYLWPGVAFILLPGANVLLVFGMNPTGPETTWEPLLYYTLDGKLDAATQSAVDWFNDILGPEDVEICESVQRGLHSMGYRAGRLMVDPDCTARWSEHFLHHFNRLNLAAIGG